MFKVQVTKQFNDLVEKEKRYPGDIFNIDSVERVKELLSVGPYKEEVIKIICAKKRASSKYEGKKMIIYQNYLYYIGGIETFLQNFTKHYKDKNITLVCRTMSNQDIINMSEYCDVIIDNNGTYECDVLLLGNYNGDVILSRVKASKVYQMIHADWEGLTKLSQWAGFKWKKNPRIDTIISVSESTARGLKNTMGYDSKIIYNILDDSPKDDMRTFITLSRATPEKGIERIIKMAKAFKEQGKHFIWFLCCSLEQAPRHVVEQIRSIPEFVVIKPGVHNKALINKCDYLVQLSDTESFCYSAFEALQRGVPVIITNFPEAYNIIDDGENGYIVDMQLSNLDVDKIFNHIPKPVYYIDRCNYDSWEQVFAGEF